MKIGEQADFIARSEAKPFDRSPFGVWQRWNEHLVHGFLQTSERLRTDNVLRDIGTRLLFVSDDGESDLLPLFAGRHTFHRGVEVNLVLRDSLAENGPQETREAALYVLLVICWQAFEGNPSCDGIEKRDWRRVDERGAYPERKRR